MRYIFNPITEQLEAPDNPSPMYDNLGKKFKLAESVLPYDFDDLTPREEQYYQQDKFSTHPEFLAAKGGRVGFEKGTIKPVLNDQESFLEWTQENIGEEAKGSKFLGTAWDALSDPIKSGFGGKYDARTIFPSLDSVSQTALNVLAPWGEKAFDIIDAAWRLPGAAAADIATMAGADEGSVKKLQAEMNVALGIPLGRLPKMLKKFKTFVTPKFTNQTQIKGIPDEVITKKVPSKYLGDYIKQKQKDGKWRNTFELRLPVRKTKTGQGEIRKTESGNLP